MYTDYDHMAVRLSVPFRNYLPDVGYDSMIAN